MLQTSGIIVTTRVSHLISGNCIRNRVHGGGQQRKTVSRMLITGFDGRQRIFCLLLHPGGQPTIHAPPRPRTDLPSLLSARHGLHAGDLSVIKRLQGNNECRPIRHSWFPALRPCKIPQPQSPFRLRASDNSSWCEDKKYRNTTTRQWTAQPQPRLLMRPELS